MSVIEKLKNASGNKLELEAIAKDPARLTELVEVLERGYQEQNEVMGSVNGAKREVEILTEKAGNLASEIEITTTQKEKLQKETMDVQNEVNGVKSTLAVEVGARDLAVGEKDDAIKKKVEVEKEIENKKEASKKEIEDLDNSVQKKREASKVIAENLQKEYLKAQEDYVEKTDSLIVVTNSLEKKQDDFDALLAQEKVILEDIDSHKDNLNIVKQAIVSQNSILEGKKSEITAIDGDITNKQEEKNLLINDINTTGEELKVVVEELATKTKEKMDLAQKKIDLDEREIYLKERFQEAGIPW